MKNFYKLSNDSLPAYFASYKTLIQSLTTKHLEDQYIKHSE